MKRILFVIAIGLIILSGCTGVKTLSTGLENESFLEFIGKPANYSNGVDVNIDDTTTFKAEVNKDHADRPKGKVYAISTGTHTVTVSHNNNVIFKKQIFVSAQETKKIILP
ncbi:hypothetical protein [Draconibacterium orientale]|uniref:hypothetical protein n=1 Tax=Draconibacterium orientale TaxID=1168034 RepID=UPI0029BFEDB0|nr:hypothetical protein [Draconibacterium orientale]MBN2635912.1 hypothetical protein [Prolixibacteraceae bacterium]